MLTRDLHIEQRRWTVAESFAHCERITRDHYENFPVASLFLPRDKRKYVAAVYAFARTADDFADKPGMTPAERIEALNDWDMQLLECYHGVARNPVFIALMKTIERFEIPVDLFRRLLQAFRSDVTTNRYETFEDLLGYCRNSANPVGRLVLLLFNYRSEKLMQRADAICTGLQLANFWQDLSVDLQNNRVYLPQEDLGRFRYGEAKLFSHAWTQEFRELMAFEVHRTEELFRQGEPLLNEVGRDLAFELRLTWHSGMRILEKIRQMNHNVLAQRPLLSWRDKTGIVLSSLIAR